ncbi:MAG: ATP-binding cassette, subfamily bacterial MsbA, partial [Verrucomicrobiota bacterium]
FFRRIWTFMRPYKTRLILGVVCGILYGLSNGLLIGVIQLVINVVFPGTERVSIEQHLSHAPAFLQPLVSSLIHRLPELKSPSSNLGVALLIATIPVVMLLRALFGYLNIYLMTWSAAHAVADLRTRLFDHLQNLSLSFFSRARTGDLISRITNDTYVLYGIMGNSLASVIKDPITILVLLIYLWSQQPILTLISVVVLPVCLVPIIIYGRKVRKSARAMQGHISDLSSLMHESFTANRIIKAYNLEQTVLAQFKESTKKYIGQIMRVIRANEIPSQLTEFLGAVGISLVLLYVAFQTDRTKPPGDFVGFILSIVLMYPPIKSLARLHNQLHQAASASQHVFELLDTASTVVDPPHPVPLTAAGAHIHFENVNFDYGDKPVLRGVNLTVKAGQLVALVGASGSGKTTLTNLLLRFYDPQQGSVRIGPTDLRHASIKDLRRQIALVAQETILFNDTIRHNIAVGRPGATAAEIETAARHAFAHDFIVERPQGYETLVGEKGIALSGGQRQRIAIARAILKDAPILVLDEATNALDAESERAVQKALDGLMEGRTTICIAHRLSTIQKADLIVVLANGRIAESGTHAELIQSAGVYSKLYELQFEPVPT